MAKYVEKPRIAFDVFQMTKERRYDNSEWPQWLHEAWNAVQGNLNSFYCKNGSEEVYIKIVADREDEIEWNDYILQGPRGDLFVLGPELFEKNYMLA